MSAHLVDEYTCCITLRVMNQPVQAPCGHCFEKNAILEWLALKSTCPLDRSPLKKENLAINKELSKKITVFLKEYPEFKETSPKKTFLNRIKKVVTVFMKSDNLSAVSYHRILPCPLPIFPNCNKGFMGLGTFSCPQ